MHVHDAPRRRRARSYLTKVGAPLALNMYTAVHNNISLEGRQAVCAGVLSNVDLRPKMKHLPMPLIVVASSQARARGPLVSRAFRINHGSRAQDGLVKPSHVAAMVEARGGEEPSIKRALAAGREHCAVVWLRAGHAVFQARALSNSRVAAGQGARSRERRRRRCGSRCLTWWSSSRRGSTSGTTSRRRRWWRGRAARARGAQGACARRVFLGDLMGSFVWVRGLCVCVLTFLFARAFDGACAIWRRRV